jgi:hypothetical protein
MHLSNIPESRINAVEVLTGLPLVYDPQLQKIRLLQEQARLGNPEGSGQAVVAGRALLEKHHCCSRQMRWKLPWRAQKQSTPRAALKEDDAWMLLAAS